MSKEFCISKDANFGPLEQQDFMTVKERLGSGADLAPFYRAGIDDSPDLLLSKHKVMHLHLGGKGADTLLYLVQFECHVVLLGIDTHVHLDDVPPGKKFPNGFHLRLAALVKAAVENAEREAMLRGQAETEHQVKVRAAADKLRQAFMARRRDPDVFES